VIPEARRERLLGLFRAEAKESLAALSAGALDVEQGRGSREQYDAMFRAAHTVKGGARMLALDEIAKVADEAESLLRGLRDGEIEAGREVGGRLIGLADELSGLIWPPEPAVQAAELPNPTRSTVRVPSDRIDAVVALASEARRTQHDPRALDELLATTEAAALRLRLMPLEGLFADLRRAVRDAAESDGKQARLETEGGDVEADAAVVDAAAEILLQLIRNAVAHGIEPPVERERAGKPPFGTIRLTVAARGGWLELVVADDGGGVDETSLRARAGERGLSPDAAVQELLFAPGLSTRSQADSLGGQGVGLDVVRARTGAAGGEVAVDWRAGQGTTFTIRLPVTALYERLAVARLGDTPIGVPADAVDSIASAGDGLPVDGPVDELSVLTVPLGPLFAPNRLAKRAWIQPDGRVGIVLDPQAV
jgi:chemotaxis protein histidine kinase CheA